MPLTSIFYDFLLICLVKEVLLALAVRPSSSIANDEHGGDVGDEPNANSDEHRVRIEFQNQISPGVHVTGKLDSEGTYAEFLEGGRAWTLGPPFYHGVLAHIEKINGSDVSFADPASVTEVWAMLASSKRKYTVTFAKTESHFRPMCVIGLGVVPACLGMIVACFGLPCMIWRTCRRKAIEDVASPEPDSKEASKESFPKLREFFMSQILEHSATRCSVVVFALGNFLLGLSASFHLLTAGSINCAVLVLAKALRALQYIIVAFNVTATNADSIQATEMMCPRGVTDALQKDLRLMLFFFIPIFFTIFVCASSLSSVPVHIFRKGFSLNILAAACITGTDMLVACMVPHFILKARIRAKVVEAHVRVQSQELKDILQKDALNELDMSQVHRACVYLSSDVLPLLKCLAIPSLGFAACSWCTVAVSILQQQVQEVFNQTAKIAMLVLLVSIYLPLGVLCLLPPASVSDAVDDLLDSLNKLRTLHGLKSDAEIQLTERFIKESNCGQGLGFLLLGTVVNRRLIQGIFVKIAGYASVGLGLAQWFLQSHQNHLQLLAERSTNSSLDSWFVEKRQKDGAASLEHSLSSESSLQTLKTSRKDHYSSRTCFISVFHDEASTNAWGRNIRPCQDAWLWSKNCGMLVRCTSFSCLLILWAEAWIILWLSQLVPPGNSDNLKLRWTRASHHFPHTLLNLLPERWNALLSSS